MNKSLGNWLVFFLIGTFCLIQHKTAKAQRAEVFIDDKPFVQDYSIKYYFEQPNVSLKKVASDRNGRIQVLSSKGLLHTYAGEFLYPGTLEPDGTHRPMADKNIGNLAEYDHQLVYLDDRAVLSNAWAGKLFSKHEMSKAKMFAGGEDFAFLVSDGKELKYLRDSEQIWKGKISNPVLEIKYNSATGLFWILTSGSLHTFSAEEKELKMFFEGSNFTSFDVVAFGSKTIIGTSNGYIELNNLTQKQTGEIKTKLPVPQITMVKEVNGNTWFGSQEGAFMLHADEKFKYYYGERWLPGDSIIDIAEGPDGSVLILTEKGLGQICYKKGTLYEKSQFFEKQVRSRHIRNGLNSVSLAGMKNGNLSTGYLSDSDNDGLWTSMYLGGQAFRYAVTKSKDALQNCIESLDAMERLYTVNPVEGFPARSFERSGYINVLNDSDRWQHSSDPEWDWKATTSSDEAIGHAFVLGVIAELIDVEPIRAKAIRLLDGMMQHIVDNDLYLVDFDGKPTTWARWNPEYVNGFPTSVGDRKLNSSNIIAMLQSAYYFTDKEIYKEKAFELMEEHGYLENLMRPIEEIGKAPEGADDYSKMLSSSWNHSDDEMYYLGYWGLYRYAFNDSLKALYKEAIIDHWQAERPEKEGLWNIMTALVGDENYDFKEAAWYLRRYPLDLINWTVKNSHRKDIEYIPDNFRKQTITEVLPPDELRISKHNANLFQLDGGNGGQSENSAGDIWLLPYWIGRYLNVIGAPVCE
ncbi:MAG TPA: hypothetical protein VLZ33_07055 [Dysgonamonadaceae bacterium]|nr:hypothetical protein [Dysgonamonadaceae bacterium]